jgi:hypothetical protein
VGHHFASHNSLGLIEIKLPKIRYNEYKFMDVPQVLKFRSQKFRALVETGRQYGEYGKDGQLVRIPTR